mmetsp:Transcript_23123/g.75387  ORF Transcript_23123/g.75387 Transcript_23123/m.75387 type:complete len:421 (-) Transcript_23123:54-1316(-)
MRGAVARAPTGVTVGGGPRRGHGCARGRPARVAQKDEAESLIPETLAAMAEDPEFQAIQKALKEEGQRALTRKESKQRRVALSDIGVNNFDEFVWERCGAEEGTGATGPRSSLARTAPITTLQVNIGLYCNMACTHCHVESSPLRKEEQMDAATVDRLLELLRGSPEVRTLDVTGGAPELNPNFRTLVRGARELGLEVIDRCNLTVLLEPGQGDLAQFLADNGVTVVASLPCYSEANVDKQRGRGVFDKSIEALKMLNAVGYGVEGSSLTLDLMYNPGGPFLPPSSEKLEGDYKQKLADDFGITFSSLLTLTNMPIKRFADFLVREGELEAYMQLLVDNFNPSAVGGVMCKNLISVDWQGNLFDCDFNQQLGLELPGKDAPRTVFEIGSLADVTNRAISTDSHCFGCTAGAGSSCGGALV